MRNRCFPNLYMDPTFAMLIAPKTAATRKIMEAKLLQSGNGIPIRIWEDRVLVDQERYLFCRMHNISFTVKKMQFQNMLEAIVWVCKHQMRRMDLAEEMRRYLIGRRAQAERQALEADEASSGDTETANGQSVDEMLARIGQELQISGMTVRKYENYTQSIDRIMMLDPILAQKILCGQVKVSMSQILKTQELHDKECMSFLQYYLSGEDKRPTVTKYKAGTDKAREKAENAKLSLGMIKEMPAYDPDAEVASLALTIPSWVDSMQRTEKVSDYDKISDRSRKQLICELDRLMSVTFRMLADLYEEDYNE